MSTLPLLSISILFPDTDIGPEPGVATVGAGGGEEEEGGDEEGDGEREEDEDEDEDDGDSDDGGEETGDGDDDDGEDSVEVPAGIIIPGMSGWGIHPDVDTGPGPVLADEGPLSVDPGIVITSPG